MNTYAEINKATDSSKSKSSFFGSSKSTASFIQPKLTINAPNDQYEQEADAMADKVMRMEKPGVQLKPLPITAMQRKCAHCEEEEQQLQRKEKNDEEVTADYNLESYVGGLSGGGQPLPNEVRNFYEPRFGYDFGNVKVHTDSVATKSAQSINALAYTSGNNIVFNSGQYAPGTDSGKKLLGHELTHVVQQTGQIQTARLPCKSKKTINVYTISLPGSTRDTYADVAYSNTLLCQCGIELKIIGGQSWNTNLMDGIAPVNVLNEYASPGSPTTEEVEMLSHAPGGDALHLYFVPALSAGSDAESFWTSGFPTVRNGVAISDGARNCAVAHEIGHVLMDDGGHHGNKDNLMANGKVNTCAGELEQSQCNKM
ncbi:MAG: DUF4157 domain-containing protein [Ferruginibacter sp.]